jgi:hypothetical protein
MAKMNTLRLKAATKKFAASFLEGKAVNDLQTEIMQDEKNYTAEEAAEIIASLQATKAAGTLALPNGARIEGTQEHTKAPVGNGEQEGNSGLPPVAGPNATPPVDPEQTKGKEKRTEKEKLADKLKPYLEAYPNEKAFHLTSDGQVFLGADLILAREHQRGLDKEKEVQTLAAKA